ncbi:MAG: GxxExxY protein [Chloroflexi bacterium]|nr:GxxExxY protein [Chloroflexota bacterium]
MNRTDSGLLGQVTESIIGCAIEVHRNLGPGLLGSIYESALCYELNANNIPFERQVQVPVIYKGQKLGEHRHDILVENQVIVELKAVDRMDPIFEAQLLSYSRVTGKKVGLLINFNVPVLKRGIKRMIL